MGREQLPERNAEIRRRRSAGESVQDLAAEFGVSGPRITHICRPHLTARAHRTYYLRRKAARVAAMAEA